jgi:cytochrome c-type biogenesis protein CcmH/NrfF
MTKELLSPHADRRPARRPTAALILATALAAAAIAILAVAIKGPEPPRTMDERAHAVAATLRCPVCQDLSVADSSSPLAREMRRTIEVELRAGRTPDEIRARFVAAYGDWILLRPTAGGLNLFIWLAPALLLLGGLVVAVVAIRRWTLGGTERPGSDTVTDQSGVTPGEPALSKEDRHLLDQALGRGEAGPE